MTETLTQSNPNSIARYVPRHQIEPSPFQHRRTFAPEELHELAQSIQEHGMLQPILVRPIEGKTHEGILFQIVAGERRWRAATALDWEAVPAIVRPMTDIQAAEISLTENLQRDDPDDWAIAVGLKNLMEMSAKAGEPMSERALARRMKKSTTYISNFLGLFDLDPKLQKLVQGKSEVRSSAYEIQKVKDTEHLDELIQAVYDGAPFLDIKQRVEKILNDEAWKRDSQKLPDKETRDANRLSGKRLQQAQHELNQSLSMAERGLIAASAWLGEVPEGYYQQSVLPRVQGLQKRLSEQAATAVLDVDSAIEVVEQGIEALEKSLSSTQNMTGPQRHRRRAQIEDLQEKLAQMAKEF